MSWSYDITLSTNKDKVRLKIMDVQSASPEFSDEEINAILNEVGQDVTQAAYRMAKSLAFKYAKNAISKRAGPYSEDTTSRANLFKSLAEQLADEADEPWEEYAENPIPDQDYPYKSRSEQDFLDGQARRGEY